MEVYTGQVCAVLSIVVVAAVIGMTPDGCQDGWNHFQDHCYSFIPAQVHFDSAKGVCMVKGASLVSLWKQDEIDFVTHSLKQVLGPGQAAWVGLVPGREGAWRWMDGSSFTPPMEGAAVAVLPSDETEACGAVGPDGTITYIDCSRTVSAFVCKTPLQMLYMSETLHNFSMATADMETGRTSIIFEKIKPPLLNEIELGGFSEFHLATVDVTKETDCAYRCYIVDDCLAFTVWCKSSMKCDKYVCTLLTDVKLKLK